MTVKLPIKDCFGRNIHSNTWFWYQFQSTDSPLRGIIYIVHFFNSDEVRIRFDDILTDSLLDDFWYAPNDEMLTLKEGDLTYGQYNQLPQHIKDLSVRLSELDLRPAHPEDYVFPALKLIQTKEPHVRFEMVKVLAKHHSCHTDYRHTMSDFLEFVCK